WSLTISLSLFGILILRPNSGESLWGSRIPKGSKKVAVASSEARPPEYRRRTDRPRKGSKRRWFEAGVVQAGIQVKLCYSRPIASDIRQDSVHNLLQPVSWRSSEQFGEPWLFINLPDTI